ncbi:hypothetical protein J0A67_17340 [Algoriphagus aestuariicola]|uniref:Terpene synthase n=1 Tax=Algoriphagus aestuariicola TaxID=1852016 RepID=A0ABS3BTM9_9BACT|nr:terpene synthase family protein [Algoriphagus aestuariicola]MBN7802644.1 hypothetical protein [Algoriphagus aestuariicola]
MTNLIFPSALNSHTPILNVKILRWAWKVGLFESPSELERCRIQKVNWFAGYLFPEENSDKLELIMRFFLCLFLLDDLLDTFPESDSSPFLKGLKNSIAIAKHPRLSPLGKALLQSHESLGNGVSSQIWRSEWMEAWGQYLSGLQWEVDNKSNDQMPRLEDYRMHRPSSSGVYLAIHLLRSEDHPDCCEADLLEDNVARFICLSNDVISYEKEFSIGDFHNELIILGNALGENVKPWAIQEIKSIQKRIMVLAKQVGSKSEACQLWVERLFLLLGGCLAWTEETSRYMAYVNGNLKSS